MCSYWSTQLFFCLSKIVKTSLAYYLKQRECFAWIRSLTFVEFCKCKLSEGYWYFWYLCCIFSMMYLCLRNHAGRKRNFSNTHCTTRWHTGHFSKRGLFFKHKTLNLRLCHFQLVSSNPYRGLMSLPVRVGGAEVDRTEYRWIFSHVYKLRRVSPWKTERLTFVSVTTVMPFRSGLCHSDRAPVTEAVARLRVMSSVSRRKIPHKKIAQFDLKNKRSQC